MKNNSITQNITERSDIATSLFFKDISHYSCLSIEEENNLIKEIKQGNKEAESKLIKCNLRFVVSIAKQYQHKGLPLMDLVQEGSIGMLNSLHNYDETRGFKFISYAVWWIRQAIIKALTDNSRTVKAPVNQILTINKINKIVEKIEQKENREANISELSDEMDINENKINLAYASFSNAISIETPVKDEDNNCLLDIIPSNMFETGEEIITKKERINAVHNALNKLKPREKDIIVKCFGIGTTKKSINRIADEYNISVERIGQIRKNSLKKLKRLLSKTIK